MLNFASQKEYVTQMEKKPVTITEKNEVKTEEPQILEEIVVEELSIDGICGVY
jgi:mycofactocin precursor